MNGERQFIGITKVGDFFGSNHFVVFDVIEARKVP
jgi:hypothetical protein